MEDKIKNFDERLSSQNLRLNVLQRQIDFLIKENKKCRELRDEWENKSKEIDEIDEELEEIEEELEETEKIEEEIENSLKEQIKKLVDKGICKSDHDAAIYVENVLWDFRDLKPSFARKLKKRIKKNDFVKYDKNDFGL